MNACVPRPVIARGGVQRLPPSAESVSTMRDRCRASGGLPATYAVSATAGSAVTAGLSLNWLHAHLGATTTGADQVIPPSEEWFTTTLVSGASRKRRPGTLAR